MSIRLSYAVPMVYIYLSTVKKRKTRIMYLFFLGPHVAQPNIKYSEMYLGDKRNVPMFGSTWHLVFPE